MYFHGARFSNYEAWLSDPTHIKPSAQVVWPIVGQEILNGDVGGGFQGIQITSGFFQLWRASGITSELQLYTTAIGGLVMAVAMFFAGWFHYHKAAPKLEWFQNVESMLNHHLAGLLGLGSLSWAGHQIHVSLPVNKLLDAGVDPKEIPLPHDLLLNRDIMADLYPSFSKGLAPFFTLNWSEYSDFLTFKGGLNPVTGGLWLSDTAHHHVAIAVLFLVAGHMYRTNWGIGHSMKEILEAHRGPFTGEGHVGLYEILTTSWHAQLAINLALFGSLSIIVAFTLIWVTLNPTICWNLPLAQFEAYPQVLGIFTIRKSKLIFLSVLLILPFSLISGQTLVRIVSRSKQISLRKNLDGRNNQQETFFNRTYGQMSNDETIDYFKTKTANAFNRQKGSSETLRGTFFFQNLEKPLNFKNSLKAKQSNYDFSEYNNLKPIHKGPGKLTSEEIKFLEWFIGFTEGDGSFYIKDNRLIFVINQADFPLLQKIRTILGFGVVTPFQQNNRLYASYRVQGTEKIKKLIAIFNGNIHLQKVFNRFQNWVDKYNTYATDSNNPIVVKPRRSPQEITLNSAWLSGFFDAEGGFFAGISNVSKGPGEKVYLRLRLNAYVDQKFEHDIMNSIKDLFHVKSVTIRSLEKQLYRVEINKKESLEILLKYFEKYPLRGKKHITYAMWKKIANLYLKGMHKNKIHELRKQVEKTQEQNNQFKMEKKDF
jgi:hypothetical protein